MFCFWFLFTRKLDCATDELSTQQLAHVRIQDVRIRGIQCPNSIDCRSWLALEFKIVFRRASVRSQNLSLECNPSIYLGSLASRFNMLICYLCTARKHILFADFLWCGHQASSWLPWNNATELYAQLKIVCDLMFSTVLCLQRSWGNDDSSNVFRTWEVVLKLQILF